MATQDTQRLPVRWLVASCLAFASTANAGSFEWTLSQHSRGKASLVLADRELEVASPSGWACTVGAPSGSGGIEERLTTCRKNGEQVRFVVLCEPNRPNDRIQIQLGSDKAFDYIEVECKPKKLVLLPNKSLERTRDR